MQPYRPRRPEVVAMIAAMPADVDALQAVGGRSRNWTLQVLSRLVCAGICTRRHDVYRVAAEVEPSYSLQILDALKAGPMTRSEVYALGVNAKSASTILDTLERRGLIMVDSSRRPFRYSLPSPSLSSGLEALADFDARR